MPVIRGFKDHVDQGLGHVSKVIQKVEPSQRLHLAVSESHHFLYKMY